MKKMVIYLVILLLSSSCNDLLKDDTLSIGRKNIDGSILQTDGYYSHTYSNNPDYLEVYFFYRNGLILHGGAFKKSELPERLAQFISEQWVQAVKDSKFRWGGFEVSGSNISFERWYPSDPPLKAYVSSGEVVNDSTFIIKKRFRLVSGKETDLTVLNDVFEFNSFRPKPDSTNKFIP